MMHSDLGNVGPIKEARDRTHFLKLWTDMLLEASGERTLLIPTFHYGFPKSLVYDLRQDFGTVGILGKYLSQRYPDLRTRTPIWNFVILRNQDFRLSPAVDPFGKDSTFADFVERDGILFSPGLDSSMNTIYHYFEDFVGVPFRYTKRFKGKVIDDLGKEETIDFQFQARPVKPADA